MGRKITESILHQKECPRIDRPTRICEVETMMRSIVASSLSFVIINVGLAQESINPNIKSRSFVFTYAGAVTQLPVNKTAKVWLPLAISSAEQDVALAKVKLPGNHRHTKDKLYGNDILYFEAKADDKGEVPFH